MATKTKKKNLVRRNCFICRKELVGTFGEGVVHPFEYAPEDAIVFTSRGNWGSTVLDQPPGQPSVEISICDACYVERQDLIIEFHERRRVEFEFPVKKSKKPCVEEPRP